MNDDRIYVGVMYGHQWDFRPKEELARDFDLLRAIDPRIEIIDVEYREPHEFGTARGQVPMDPTLRDRAPELTKEQKAALSLVDIVVSNDLPFELRKVAPRLRFIQSMGAGVSQLLSCDLAEAGIRLASAAGINSVGISEFVVGRILQHYKRHRELDEAQQLHEWRHAVMLGPELAGATVGLIGMGYINREVAKRLKAFDCRIVASRQSWTPGATAANVDELYSPRELERLLAQSDVIVAAVPETPETTDILNERQFAQMKKGAFFVNVGRGTLLDERALIEALRSGHLAGAAIDVAREEPLPPENPLWDAPNLYISPHAATSQGKFFARLHEVFRENVRRFLGGEELLNEVAVRPHNADEVATERQATKVK